MDSISTLRRRAQKIGYSISSGKNPLNVPSSGKMIIDLETNNVIAGSCCGFPYIWDLEDVEAFLKEEYEALGLEW